jgi:hypothetical protein
MVEIPGELKPDLQRTLLGPLSLATELFGALIPGSVFLIIMCVKLRWATPILTNTLVGYVTKVVLALLASYVIGKVSLSAISLVRDSVTSLAGKLKSSEEEPPAPTNPTALQSLLIAVAKWVRNSPPWFTTFLGGLVGASILSNKSELFHHYTASQAEAAFHLNTGLLLITASLIPGDGHFRWLELGAGAILLAGGVRQTFQNRLLMAGSYGMVLNDYLKSHSPDKVVGTLVAVLKLLATLAKTPAGSEVPTAPSPAEEAATETTTETAEAVSTPDGTSSPT